MYRFAKTRYSLSNLFLPLKSWLSFKSFIVVCSKALVSVNSPYEELADIPCCSTCIQKINNIQIRCPTWPEQMMTRPIDACMTRQAPRVHCTRLLSSFIFKSCILWETYMFFNSAKQIRQLMILKHHKLPRNMSIDLTYSISQEICTRFCCALLCCGYAIVHNEFTWSIYPYSSGLLCWHWGNR